ncbi:methionyl-tRNA formyltransferase [Thauera sp. CAU 1555]|uniref:Methionyl-tRNA formyltransferase n=1 Tax=Thauera sedimentorum TaxID=2767595 RepID=A0ABR9B6E9_9RHOO|nr:methionyl-tRNA formyltransferase [Thauera sedimentorum]MBC9070842.1 methionyl-tRNA formyltransferase [Thauera sedimentorum]MBD8501761.1 methionyl-tRNA formyltransferase [Thauera sedimentorum]
MTRLGGVVLLAAPNLRARAYADAMLRAGLGPERVVLFGPVEEPAAPTWDAGTWPHGLPRPFLDEPVERIAKRGGWPVTKLAAASVNDPCVARALHEAEARFVIYAGIGGQLVSAETLGAAPFLHIHSGWLPRWRGSTTLYYSLLETGRCASSAILLDPGIDTGALLARRHYPPPVGGEIDHYYDGAIRADLLLRVLRHYARHGSLPAPRAQTGRARTYYVIHPVLKHVARLMTERRDALAGSPRP